MIMTVLPQIFKSSPGARTGVRPPNPTFNTSFEIVRPSPSLLEHPQALSGPNKRTIRGGGRGTCHALLNLVKSWIFLICTQTPLEGPLMVLVD